ncbi:MAG: hypothetical protein ACM3PY_21050 [Omnitrophica WOR_2 bacterium]
MSSKKKNMTREQRHRRTQQIILTVISLILILAWVLALIAK